MFYPYIPILSFITAFGITFFAIPSIIRIAEEKHLFDEPGERASHISKVPTLGGLAIFAGLLFAIIFWVPFSRLPLEGVTVQYTLCAYIIIFLIGAKDDIIPLSPGKKFAGQVFAAVVLVMAAKVRISSFYGMFGIQEIPYALSIAISLFTIIVVINAFNLIDGINGLSGSIGILICLSFGSWFFMIGRMDLVVVAAAMVGALLAFLRYNFTPARIFMGDTGSLLIGLTAAILAIEFMEASRTYRGEWSLASVPSVAIGVLIIPLFDTLRVFIIRILRGRSPFHPDRSHVHHLLIDSGLTHLQATFVLVLTNTFFVGLVVALQGIGTLELLLLILAIATALSLLLSAIYRRQVAKQQRIKANEGLDV